MLVGQSGWHSASAQQKVNAQKQAWIGKPLAVHWVRDFGAKGDGKSLDTKAIQAAIDAVAKQGGFVVLLPAGRYLSGTIILQDFVILRVDLGATLLDSIT